MPALSAPPYPGCSCWIDSTESRRAALAVCLSQSGVTTSPTHSNSPLIKLHAKLRQEDFQVGALIEGRHYDRDLGAHSPTGPRGACRRNLSRAQSMTSEPSTGVGEAFDYFWRARRSWASRGRERLTRRARPMPSATTWRRRRPASGKGTVSTRGCGGSGREVQHSEHRLYSITASKTAPASGEPLPPQRADAQSGQRAGRHGRRETVGARGSGADPERRNGCSGHFGRACEAITDRVTSASREAVLGRCELTGPHIGATLRWWLPGLLGGGEDMGGWPSSRSSLYYLTSQRNLSIACSSATESAPVSVSELRSSMLTTWISGREAVSDT